MVEESAINAVVGINDNNDFSLTEGNVRDLKKLFSKKRRKSLALKTLRKNAAEKAKKLDQDPIEPAWRDFTLRGVLETNLWARQICRDHRALAKEHMDNLQRYENVEPQMYKIGRSVDKILGSLRTSLVYKVDNSSPTHTLQGIGADLVSASTSNDDSIDIDSTMPFNSYFTLIDASSLSDPDP